MSATSTRVARFWLCFSLGLGLGCDKRSDEALQTPEPGAQSDTTSVDAQLAELEEPARRGAALRELSRLAFETAEGGDLEAIAAFRAKVLPAIAGHWAEATPGERLQLLTIALRLPGPEAEPLWSVALASGNPDEVALALEGVERGGTTGAGAAMLERVEAELAGFEAEDQARARMLLQLIEGLGDIRYREAVEPLIRLLAGPDQARPVQRVAITALGRIGDPRAVDTLLAVQFRIPDTPGTLSIGERALRAIGAIGEAALPGVLVAFAGGNQQLNRLAEDVGLDPSIVRLSMVRQLGIIGSPRATQPLLDAFPRAGCGSTPALADEDAQSERERERAFFAHALGFIADPAAVPALCECIDNGNPGPLYEIVNALGRIGGPEASACLATVLERGRYDADLAASGEELMIRWEAVRWAVIAAAPGDHPALVERMAKLSEPVRARVEAEQLDIGLGLLVECGERLECYEGVLADPARHPFERERAAFEVARAAQPGDRERAALLAGGFAAFEPSVRINMAWLAGKVAAGQACPACIAALDEVMRAEELTKPKTMQAAWMMARQTIDKAHAGEP